MTRGTAWLPLITTRCRSSVAGKTNWSYAKLSAAGISQGVTALQTGFPVTIQDKGTPNSLYCNAGQFLSYYNCPDTPDASSFNIKTFNPRNLESPVVRSHTVHSGTAWQSRAM